MLFENVNLQFKIRLNLTNYITFASLCNKLINSSKLSAEINFTADFGAGFSNFTALVFTGASTGSTTVSAFDLAVIIPLMFGIRKSFSSTNPF